MKHTEALVVGSGAFGASVAFHLARRGRAVTVVDRLGLVSQTSPRAAGVTAHIPTHDDIARIGLRSIKKMVAFESETGEPLAIHRNGAIKLSRSRQDASLLHMEVDRGRRLGVDVEEISAVEAQNLAPWLNTKAGVAFSYTPDEFYLNPGDLPTAYLKAAAKLGAVLLPHTEVTGFKVSNGRIDYASTTAGVIETDAVVSAAGAWTRVIAGMVGAHVPLMPTRHQLCITGPISLVEPGHPTIRVVDANVYVRPEGNSLLFGAYEPNPSQHPELVEEPQFAIERLPLDMTPLRTKMEEVEELIPGIHGADIQQLRGGLPTITPDGLFIVDRLVRPHNFYVVAGCNVMGLFCSPGLGELTAEWLITGTRPVDLEPFSLRRFGREYRDAGRLSAACREMYAHKFKLDMHSIG